MEIGTATAPGARRTLSALGSSAPSVDEDAPVSNIVSADKSLRVMGFVRSDTVIENKSYARWQGAMKAGSPVVLEFGSSAVPGWVLPAILGVMGIVLVAITRVAMRRSAVAP